VELEDEKEALNIHNWGAWVLRKRAWGQSKVSWSQSGAVVVLHVQLGGTDWEETCS